MIQIANLQIEKHGRCLLHNTSFCFSDTGAVSFYGEDKELNFAFAQILSGQRIAPHAEIRYQDTLLHSDDAYQRALYRSTYVSYLYGDFQLLYNKSVYDNIVLGLHYDPMYLQAIIQKWNLENVLTETMEDCSFSIQVRSALARVELHAPTMLVVYPPSTPFSDNEKIVLYEMLQIAGNDMLVIVIGDTGFEPYAKRCIRVENGYVLSDDLQGKEEGVKLWNMQKTLFSIPEHICSTIMKKSNEHYRWWYRGMAVLLLFAFVFSSIIFFIMGLNLVNIDMELLSQSGYSVIALEKHAQGNDGTIYSSQYSEFYEKDIETLEANMNGDFIYRYFPVDGDFANRYFEGIYDPALYSSVNMLGIIEASSLKALGIQDIYGEFPETFDEVALTYSTAVSYGILKEDETAADLIGKVIMWYGLPLRICGIIPEEENVFEQLMPSISNAWWNSNNQALFVKSGFINQHPLSRQSSFPVSYKRLVNDKSAYSISHIYGVTTDFTYYDGESIGRYALQDGEVVLDFYAAITLGYDERVFFNPEFSEMEKLSHYLKFAKEWIGKDIYVQAYTIQNLPSNSVLYQDQVTIAGFLVPLQSDYMHDSRIPFPDGSVYLPQNEVASLSVNSSGIQKLYFHTEDEGEMRHALQYLQDNDLYDASFPKSGVLENLIVDVKGITGFLFVGALLCFIAATILNIMLLHKTKERNKRVMTTYMLFGETRSKIAFYYLDNCCHILLHDIFIAVIAAMLILFFGIVSLIRNLYISWTALIYLLIPLLSGALVFALLSFFAYIYLSKHPLVEDASES